MASIVLVSPLKPPAYFHFIVISTIKRIRLADKGFRAVAAGIRYQLEAVAELRCKIGFSCF